MMLLGGAICDRIFCYSRAYKKTSEKAHGQLEIREYYQTADIKWIEQKGAWKGLKSIIMEKKTLKKGEKERVEYRNL